MSEKSFTFDVEKEYRTMLRAIKSPNVVHLFALLHALVVLVCWKYEVDDALTLTILTMTMTVILCIKKGMTIDIIAIMVIVANIVGFVVGTLGAAFIHKIIHVEAGARIVATIFTTELLGWTLIGLSRLTYNKTNRAKADITQSNTKLRWVLVIVGIIFVLRIGAAMLFTSPLYADTSVMVYAWDILSSSPALITYMCLTIIFVRRLHRKQKRTALIWLGYLLFTTIASAVGAWSFCVIQEGTITWEINIQEYLRYFIAAILVETIIYCMAVLVNSIFATRKAMQIERVRAAQAQYRYATLKQQVNPHFLFNSLNTLDGLVCEQRTEQASDYIHKLAHMYRYMLRCEEEALVSLREEIEFIREYISLLKVRFAEGFEIKFNIDDEAMQRMVIPCTVQLLVENAFKHNIVSTSNPLRISISADMERLTIENNIQPKFTQTTSTKLGQKYIREHYNSLSKQQIVIDNSENLYRVTIPLL
jgi:hypothetical protein